MRYLLVLCASAAVTLAQHPRLIIDADLKAEMQAKVSAGHPSWTDATWGLRPLCNALAAKPVKKQRELSHRYSSATVTADLFSTTAIGGGYQGENFEAAANALATCYQAVSDIDSGLATSYGTKLAEIGDVLAVSPGKATTPINVSRVTKGATTTFTYSGATLVAREAIFISGATGDWAVLNGQWNAENVLAGTFVINLNSSGFSASFDGTVSKLVYVIDSTWKTGSYWQAGVQVDGTQTTAGSVKLRGGVAGGTVTAGDAFVVNGSYSFLASANATADGNGNVTISLCSTCANGESFGHFANTPYPAGGLTDGAPVSYEIVLLASGHGFLAGQPVTVSGVAGNTAPNGTWSVRVLDSSRFLLEGTTTESNAQTNIVWDPGVNKAFGIRFFGPAAAYAYDWGHALLSSEQKSRLRDFMRMWQVMGYKLNTVGMHPGGNYATATIWGLFVTALAMEPEDPAATAAYNVYRATFWDAPGTQSGATWVAPGISQYFSDYITDWYYPDGPFYGSGSTVNQLLMMFSLMTAKGYNPRDDAKPFLWDPGPFMLHTTLPDRMTGGLRTTLNGTNGGSPPQRSHTRWNAGTLAVLHYYMRKTGNSFAPYIKSWADDFLVEAKTLPSSGPVAKPPRWPMQDADKARIFLFLQPDAPAADYTALPTYFYSTRQPELVWRSGWAKDATWWAFNASSQRGALGKYSYDAGAVYIARPNGNLVTNPVHEYYKYTQVAFDYESNSRTVLPRFANVYQVLYGGTYAQFGSRGSVVSGYDPSGNCHAIMPEMDRREIEASYVYARGVDLEKMYPSTGGGAAKDNCAPPYSAEKWSRSTFVLNNRATFVHDITIMNTAATDQMMNWSLGGPGTPAGAPSGTYRWHIHGDGTAAQGYIGTVQTLAPTGHSVKFGDPKDATTFTNAIGAQYRTGATSRLEIRPASIASQSNTWLTMFDPAPSDGEAYTATSLVSSGLDAVQLNDAGNSVVAFPQARVAVLPATYTYAAGSGPVGHYIAGLEPHTGYRVDATLPGQVTLSQGGPGTEYTASAAGVLRFETSFARNQASLDLEEAAFSFTLGGAPPDVAVVNVSTELADTAVTASPDVEWVAASVEGSGPARVRLTVNTEGLAPGTYAGNVVLSCVPACSGQTSIRVLLTVIAETVLPVVSIETGSTKALVRYRPAGLACTAQASTDPQYLSLVAGVTEVASGAGLRTIALGAGEPLVPNTIYYVRALCGNALASATFQTRAARASTPYSLRVSGAAPPALGPATLTIDYGTVAAVPLSAAIPCSAGRCAGQVPVTTDSIVYVRRRWLNASGQLLAGGTVQPLLIR